MPRNRRQFPLHIEYEARGCVLVSEAPLQQAVEMSAAEAHASSSIYLLASAWAPTDNICAFQACDFMGYLMHSRMHYHSANMLQ